jgi:hypothetical protein
MKIRAHNSHSKDNSKLGQPHQTWHDELTGAFKLRSIFYNNKERSRDTQEKHTSGMSFSY